MNINKLLLVVLSTVTMSAFAGTSTPPGWTDDYDAALKLAVAEKKHILVDFSGSDWCGWCKKLDQEVFDTEAFRSSATNDFVLLMVDSPRNSSLLSEKAKAQNLELVAKYKVRGYPTVLVLDQKGEVVYSSGYAKGGPKAYLEMLKRGVAEAPDVAKYIKPIEDVLNEVDVDMRKDEVAIRTRIAKELFDSKEPSAADRKAARAKAFERGVEIFFDEFFPKYEPRFEAALEAARKIAVPSHMEAKKQELLKRHEQRLASMRKTRQEVLSRQKGDAATAVK